jgi:hypothetical protein
VRMHPSHEEVVELIRRGYTIFEQLPSSGKRGLKRPYDDAAAAVSAPIRRIRLDLAPVQEKAAKFLEKQRNRLKQAFELKEKFSGEFKNALRKKWKTHVVNEEMLKEKRAANAAFKKAEEKMMEDDASVAKAAASR